MKDNILITLAIVLTLMFGVNTINDLRKEDQTFKGNSFAQCQTLTETSVSIGSSNSVTVLSNTSGRSWARVQLNRDADGTATSTPSIAFGAVATLENGIQLSTTTPYIEFGMDTDHPYSGIVTAINSGSASTTLRVTECR